MIRISWNTISARMARLSVSIHANAASFFTLSFRPYDCDPLLTLVWSVAWTWMVNVISRSYQYECTYIILYSPDQVGWSQVTHTPQHHIIASRFIAIPKRLSINWVSQVTPPAYLVWQVQ